LSFQPNLAFMLRSISIVVFVSSMMSLSAQDQRAYIMVPLNYQQTNLIQANTARNEQLKPTGYAPYLVEIKELDSILDVDTKNWSRKEYDSWVLRKLKNEHLFEVHTKDFNLQGDAALNLELNPKKDATGRNAYTNTRGYVFNGTVGSRIFFSTSFYETQSIFPVYMDSVVSRRGAFNNGPDPERGSVPGYGRWKGYNTSSSYDYDYTLATGSFGVRLYDNSFLQFGHDKQFVGYGYRSILLSDASTPYPFLRAQFSFWQNRITYTTTWAVLQSLDRIAPKSYNSKEVMFRRLGARFSYLSFQPASWFSLGLFDGTTWTWRGNSSPASIEYYTPQAFLYTGNGIRNHISGLNGQVTLFKMLQGYGQYAINHGGRGQAAQLGVKLFGPVRNMIIQLEYNKVGQSFYYSSADSNATTFIDEPLQKGTNELDYYQHNDLILGHPMGVALDEVIVKTSYQLRDFMASFSMNYTRQNAVNNPKTIRFLQIEGGYIINPKSNAQIVGGLIQRSEVTPNSAQLNELYPYIAFRTNIFNRYLDF
jgi:hypothetical protein